MLARIAKHTGLKPGDFKRKEPENNMRLTRSTPV